MELKPLLVYTMFFSLGDYIVMGDLARKVESILPPAKCLIAHRRNPHIHLCGILL